MDFPVWLLPLLLVWPAIKLIQLVSVMRILRGYRLDANRVELLPDAEVPDHLREASAPLAERLGAQGFTYRSAHLHRSAAGPEFDFIALEYVHPAEPIRVDVRLDQSLLHPDACHYTLDTTLADGRELVTAERADPLLAPLPPGLERELVPGADLPAILARHRARLAAAQSAGVTPESLAPAASVARAQALLNSAEAALRSSGAAEITADGGLVLGWRSAFRSARVLLRATLAAQATRRARQTGPAPTPLSDDALTEIEWGHHRRAAALRRIRLAWLPKALLMTGSLVLFCFALRLHLSPAMGLVLVLALTVHELGHLAGMRLFGHRDTQLLFLPFLGGVAVAQDTLILAPWKQLVILFLGPLPGIFAGVLFLFWSPAALDPAFVRDAGLLVVVFNAFNLLPILPLDGGRIADVAFFSRFPFLRVAFATVSAAALALLGLALDSVLLIFFGAFALLRVPVEWRHARLVKTLRATLPPAADEARSAKAILHALRQPPGDKVPLAQRLALVPSLDERVRRPRPSWTALLLAAAGYASVLAAIIMLGFALVIRDGRAEVAAARARATEAGLVEPAPRVFDALPASDNAALPILELENLWAATPRFSSETEAATRRTLELFAAAAARPGFAPAPEAIPADYASNLPTAFDALTKAAARECRHGRPDAALALADIGLATLRHLDAAPGWLMRHARTEASLALWRETEEAIAAGADVSDGQLHRLAGFTDEARSLAALRAALRRERVGGAAWFDDSDAGEEAPPGLTLFLRLLNSLNPHSYRDHAAYYDDTIALDAALADALTKGWPARDPFSAAPDSDTWSNTSWTLGEIAEELAALRVARAGLAATWMRLHGHAAPTFLNELRAPWIGETAPLTHPQTGVPLRLETRGAFLVVALPRAPASLYQDSESPQEHAWRIPASAPR